MACNEAVATIEGLNVFERLWNDMHKASQSLFLGKPVHVHALHFVYLPRIRKGSSLKPGSIRTCHHICIWLSGILV